MTIAVILRGYQAWLKAIKKHEWNFGLNRIKDWLVIQESKIPLKPYQIDIFFTIQLLVFWELQIEKFYPYER